jgi:hypothetical protein
MKTTQTIKLTVEQKARLRDMAAKRGYTIGRGNYVETGSITQLVVAIADGDYVLVPAMATEPEDAAYTPSYVRRIRETATDDR